MKKQRKKQYRPRAVSPTGGIGLIEARLQAEELRHPLSEEQITDLGVAYRLALAAMLGGHASEENWSVVVCSLNVALVLAERGIGSEYLGKVNAALEGAFRAKVRAGRKGQWGFDGEAIQAIKDAFEIHEAQINIATKQEVRDALHEVHRRVNEGIVFQEAA